MTSLANRVDEAIKDAQVRGITIKRIADACGVSVQSVYQWRKEGERNEIDGSNIVELAAVTGYEALWLMKGKGPKKRIYPKNELQESVLSAMQGSDEIDQRTIERIVTNLKEPRAAAN